MKIEIEVIKLLELDGWEVIEEYSGYAVLMKDKKMVEVSFNPSNAYQGEKECPQCGRIAQPYIDLRPHSIECPECEIEWEWKKDISEEYLKTNNEEIFDVGDFINKLQKKYKEKLEQFLQYKKGGILNGKHSTVSINELNKV